MADVALGFGRLDDYVTGSGDTYFGAIIGRYANRIANHSFTLDGTTYQLPGNNGPGDVDTLHGGPNAWNTKVWAPSIESGPGFVALKLSYTDPDGYNGFPGQVAATVTYVLTDKDQLKIEYRATTTKPTVVNLTNHTYFNLAGEGSGDVYDQLLQINAATVQPGDEAQIPVGFAPVAGTPFDFRTLKPIGRDIRAIGKPHGEQLTIAHGYDHNFVLGGSAGYRLAAVAFDQGSGIVLWTYTDQPGVQLYTGNFLVGELIGSGGGSYRQGDGFALETQHFPDSPNHIGEPDWPSVVLRPGEVLRPRTTFRFGVAGPELSSGPATPKRKVVRGRSTSPGRSTTEGQSGSPMWLGESGKCWVSRANPSPCR